MDSKGFDQLLTLGNDYYRSVAPGYIKMKPISTSLVSWYLIFPRAKSRKLSLVRVSLILFSEPFMTLNYVSSVKPDVSKEKSNFAL